MLSKILDSVISKISEKGQPLPGALKTLKEIKSEKLPTALASSSPMRVIDAVVAKFQIRAEFDAVCSAEHEPYAKPHPGVYLKAAKKLEILPQNCLAFEDSPNGVLAAKSARMICIAVPEKEMLNDKRFGIADLVLPSLEDFTIKMLDNFH